MPEDTLEDCPVIRVAFHEPRIPPNNSNAIRMVAVTGCELHLIAPLGFDLSDAGRDYHDLTSVSFTPAGRRLACARAGSGLRAHHR